MAGMRDRSIHGYFAVDYSILFDVAITNTPNSRNRSMDCSSRLKKTDHRKNPPCPVASPRTNPGSPSVTLSSPFAEEALRKHQPCSGREADGAVVTQDANTGDTVPHLRR